MSLFSKSRVGIHYTGWLGKLTEWCLEILPELREQPAVFGYYAIPNKETGVGLKLQSTLIAQPIYEELDDFRCEMLKLFEEIAQNNGISKEEIELIPRGKRQ